MTHAVYHVPLMNFYLRTGAERHFTWTTAWTMFPAEYEMLSTYHQRKNHVIYRFLLFTAPSKI